ncbi:uncharacterized protein VTP21DRAFT_1054 [Calcarisporiella thermophila]|uniref:uncharacterized protein n=1 Tax=Calcarisporiella thermophila TaxID=911321 RepID=UPI003744A4BF
MQIQDSVSAIAETVVTGCLVLVTGRPLFIGVTIAIVQAVKFIFNLSNLGLKDAAELSLGASTCLVIAITGTACSGHRKLKAAHATRDLLEEISDTNKDIISVTREAAEQVDFWCGEAGMTVRILSAFGTVNQHGLHYHVSRPTNSHTAAAAKEQATEYLIVRPWVTGWQRSFEGWSVTIALGLTILQALLAALFHQKWESLPATLGPVAPIESTMFLCRAQQDIESLNAPSDLYYSGIFSEVATVTFGIIWTILELNSKELADKWYIPLIIYIILTAATLFWWYCKKPSSSVLTPPWRPMDVKKSFRPVSFPGDLRYSCSRPVDLHKKYKQFAVSMRIRLRWRIGFNVFQNRHIY